MDGMEWNRMVWIESNGMDGIYGLNGMESNRMEWNGMNHRMEWN